jgi:peptidoglycan hydrolase-like protein with peptidoglycan-binding domain
MELTAYIYDAWAYELAHQNSDMELWEVPVDLRTIGRLWIVAIVAIANVLSAPSLGATHLEPSVHKAPWCDQVYLCDTTYMLEVQRLLEQRGFAVGAIDGVYGAQTKQAVAAFQKTQSNLAIDGVPGAKTIALLRQSAKSTPITPRRQQEPVRVLPISPNLSMPNDVTNDRQLPRPVVSEVGNLQILLKRRGFYDGSIDGLLGKSTIDAVMAAQQAYALDIDGFVGPLTMQALLAGGTNVPLTRPAFNALPNANEVQKAQELLRDRGFYRGPIDRVYGMATQASILKAQLAYGQATTGELTPALIAALQAQPRIARSPTNAAPSPPAAIPVNPNVNPSSAPTTMPPANPNSNIPNINVNLSFPVNLTGSLAVPMSRQNMPR